MDEGGFFNKITVIGLGLIGGSICKALKKSNFNGIILGIDKDEKSLQFAIENGIVDEIAYHIDDSVKSSDLVIISTYLNSYEKIFSELFDLNEEFLVMDTGSVKSFKNIDLNKFMGKIRFVGGHPMAGSEKTGVKFSDKNLFINRLFYIIKYSKNNVINNDIEAILKFTRLIGAIPKVMSEEEHDEIMALTSHLPHFIASLQMNLIMEYEGIELKNHIGKGFIDSTRIASSSPELWTDVFQMNKENIIKSFNLIEDKIELFKAMLINDESEMINEFFKSARKNRENIVNI